MEIFDIVDEKGIPTEETVERSVAHGDVVFRRSVRRVGYWERRSRNIQFLGTILRSNFLHLKVPKY